VLLPITNATRLASAKAGKTAKPVSAAKTPNPRINLRRFILAPDRTYGIILYSNRSEAARDWLL